MQTKNVRIGSGWNQRTFITSMDIASRNRVQNKYKNTEKVFQTSFFCYIISLMYGITFLCYVFSQTYYYTKAILQVIHF